MGGTETGHTHGLYTDLLTAQESSDTTNRKQKQMVRYFKSENHFHTLSLLLKEIFVSDFAQKAKFKLDQIYTCHLACPRLDVM